MNGICSGGPTIVKNFYVILATALKRLLKRMCLDGLDGLSVKQALFLSALLQLPVRSSSGATITLRRFDYHNRSFQSHRDRQRCEEVCPAKQ